MKHFILIVLISASIFSITSQELATTASGVLVELYPEGTWKKFKSGLSTNADFRNKKWGISIEELKSSEILDITYETNDSIFVPTEINDLSCNAIYIFVENKLVRGRYYFNENHTNKNAYIDNFNSLKELLIKKYGIPLNDDQIWNDDLYQSEYSEWGMAIATGQMYYYSKWETKETIIELQLWGDNYEIKHTIDYTSKKLGFLEEQAKNAKALNQL